ncbi:hypothetical protein ATO8_19874 [Roseivivax marinus]|uniref:Terminase large subunit n=1 Tax=Roseivivax marinus TaxID=1379903 RepID=W4HFZ8_9RHOB|nr:hypothetical protein [Roseivivax marinus]ETW10890.1 hypothetical protein ATO8_19874 [Roseivivax marinus]
MIGALADDSITRRFTEPGPVASAFMHSRARIVGIMGPQGGGKTTATINRILMKAASQRPGRDGKAYYRCVVWMRTYRELWAKVIPDWLEWVPKQNKAFGITWNGGVDNPAEHKFRFEAIHTLPSGEKTKKIVYAEVWFRAVGDQTPGEAAKGLHATDGWLPEATTATAEMRKALYGRLGRYPRAEAGGAPDRQLFADWNAADPYNWTSEYFIYSRPKGHDADGRPYVEFFRQPGGRAPGAENLHNLPPGYYEDQIAANHDDPDWIRRMVDNQVGFMRDGKPVYSDFSDVEHVAETRLIPWRGVPIVVAADAGLTPAAVIGQRNAVGEMQMLQEVTSRRAGPQAFARALMMALDDPRFDGYVKPTELFIDPTAANAGEASAEGEAQELESWAKIVARETGLNVRPSKCGNNLIIRTGSVESVLTRRVGTRPAFKVDREGCPELIKGMARDYKYEKVKIVTSNGEEYKEKPTKNFASHVCNAMEYFAANTGEQDVVTGKAARVAARKREAAARAQAARNSRPGDPLAAYRRGA